ncbi:trans-aconitate 2-methyltransferase [Flavihumibacter sp. ZG627]|uniref:class I SAM-dependent methyltransferase n=1 Tax=Flavihumibacter sp. ZG627 TaxID=1463156 RepID=UPI00057D4EAE|nr:class I SAM-dependent methyltransferase [Flavihumibacter sp. ZG627]KIC91647.1 SAM-dependent methyltransferase [Flavihumibacter sp. ZG627]
MESYNKGHWEAVYQNNEPGKTSWAQPIPKPSLEFIHSFNLPKNARIIDIGGGDSKLVDYLLEEGFQDITVLDISETAIEHAKKRLGHKAGAVTWILSDILDFNPAGKFDCWHDRATFHFLTTEAQRLAYTAIARSAVTGYLTIGTFADNGPEKCSGLVVKQYSSEALTREFESGFEKLKCIQDDHITPAGVVQHFTFCSFKKKNN